MQYGFRLRNYKITKSQNRARGYMMITLMLALAMITLAMRDREEEMMHRGNSYMRAIQHFYKKFGRYPTRVEELENTNNLRFLRKRYTDPMNVDPVTHKERNFKFLTQADISLNNGPVLGQTPGQSGSGSPGGLSGPGGFAGSPGTFGSPQSGPGSLGAQPGGAQQTGATTPASASGDSGSSSSGSSSSSSPSSGNSSSGNSTDTEGASTGPGSSSPSSSSGTNGQTFGGGPILGVASTSKAKTIRVFFDKNHYNDWFFIYMPLADVGGLLTGPINPNGTTGVGGLTPGLTPAGTTPGQGGSGPSGFGQGLGQGSTPNGGQTPILQPAPQPPQQAPQQ